MHTGTWAGRRGVGPRTTAHVLDFFQMGALRQPGPHILGPLVANVIVAQAGVRPPTQSVTHRDTDREREATQGYTHTQFREARPKADTYTRTASAHVARSYRETETSAAHIRRHTHVDTHIQRSMASFTFLSFALMHSHKHWHTHISHTHTYTHMHASHSYTHTLYLHIYISPSLSRTHRHVPGHTQTHARAY
jgi:hypothetical protein